MSFVLAAGALVLVLLAWLVLPLLRTRGTRAVDRAAANAVLLREQLAEVEAERSRGQISAETHAQRRAELERRALEEIDVPQPPPATSRSSHVAAIVLAAVVPVAAVLLYLQLGDPRALDPSARVATQQPQVTREDVERMVEQLAQRLQSEPNNVEGWTMLARSYALMDRHEEAARAFERLAALVPDNAQVLADYADALAMAQGQKLAGKPIELVQRALKLDPKQWKALALAGTEAFERGDFKAAIDYWERLRSGLPADAPLAQSIAQSIETARQRAGGAAPTVASKGAAAPAFVAGVVRLSPELAQRVKPDDAVFIFVRAHDGPPMPLAALRVQVRDLPKQFLLDDAAAMSPQLKLSQFPRVVVAARVSRSGNATAQSGDFEGRAGPVPLGRDDVQVTIDRVLP